MKLKQQPADFIVEEIPDYTLSAEKQEHSVFLLQKQELIHLMHSSHRSTTPYIVI